MMMQLAGKKALVTGASRGIGMAIALAYAVEGADVAVTGRSLEKLAPVVDKMHAMGRKPVALEWDVSCVKGVDSRIEETAEKLGGLDLVVNNAGVIRSERFLSVTEEGWDAVMDTNLKGLYFSCQAAANHMIKKGIKGRIINIASDAGLRGAPVPYGISKWGVIGLTKGIASLLLPHGILVAAIAPGPVTTEMMNWEPGKPVETTSPFGRMAYPEEIAQLAVFLASQGASRIAGDTIVINGGL